MNNKITMHGPGALDAGTPSETSGLFSFPSRFGGYFAPDCAPEPYQRPVCLDLPRCRGCPYADHGFACRGSDGKCMRSEAARLNHFVLKDEEEEHDISSDTEQP